ncbi:MAG: choice-of-anchor D domain-containing protein [Acidobacteriota bacterium]
MTRRSTLAAVLMAAFLLSAGSQVLGQGPVIWIQHRHSPVLDVASRSLSIVPVSPTTSQVIVQGTVYLAEAGGLDYISCDPRFNVQSLSPDTWDQLESHPYDFEYISPPVAPVQTDGQFLTCSIVNTVDNCYVDAFGNFHNNGVFARLEGAAYDGLNPQETSAYTTTAYLPCTPSYNLEIEAIAPANYTISVLVLQSLPNGGNAPPIQATLNAGPLPNIEEVGPLLDGSQFEVRYRGSTAINPSTGRDALFCEFSPDSGQIEFGNHRIDGFCYCVAGENEDGSCIIPDDCTNLAGAESGLGCGEPNIPHPPIEDTFHFRYWLDRLQSLPISLQNIENVWRNLRNLECRTDCFTTEHQTCSWVLCIPNPTAGANDPCGQDPDYPNQMEVCTETIDCSPVCHDTERAADSPFWGSSGSSPTLGTGATLKTTTASRFGSTGPEGVQIVDDTYFVLARGFDPDGLAGFAVFVDGSPVSAEFRSDMASGTAHALVIDTSDLSEGLHEVELVVIEDESTFYTPTHTRVSIWVDHSPPSAEPDLMVTRPHNGSEVPSGSDETVQSPPTTGSSWTGRYRLENRGQQDLEIETARITGDCWSLSSPPQAVIAAGQSSDLEITLECGQPGTYTGQLELHSNDPDLGIYELSITGQVVPEPGPNLRVEHFVTGEIIRPDSSFDLPGAQPQLGSRRSYKIRVSNTGQQTLSIFNAGALVSGPCWSQTSRPSSSLAPGESSHFWATLGKVCALPGAYTAQIRISSSDPTPASFEFSISGRVLPAAGPDLWISEVGGGVIYPVSNPVVFPSTQTGAPVWKLFEIENRGSETLTISNPGNFVQGIGYSLIQAPAATVPAGGSTSFRVRLMSNTAGTFAGSAEIATNDPDQSVFSIGFLGTVSDPSGPHLVVTSNGTEIQDGGLYLLPPAVPMGTSSRQFTIENRGNSALVIHQPTDIVSGDHFTLIEAPDSTVAAGASTTFRVQLRSPTVGVYSGFVEISSNDPDSGTLVFGLHGRVESNSLTP